MNAPGEATMRRRTAHHTEWIPLVAGVWCQTVDGEPRGLLDTRTDAPPDDAIAALAVRFPGATVEPLWTVDADGNNRTEVYP